MHLADPWNQSPACYLDPAQSPARAFELRATLACRFRGKQVLMNERKPLWQVHARAKPSLMFCSIQTISSGRGLLFASRIATMKKTEAETISRCERAGLKELPHRRNSLR